MQVKDQLWMLLLAASLAACVPLSTYNDVQDKNVALKQDAARDKDKAADLAQDQAQTQAEQSDKNVALAVQNHHLRIDNAALQQEGRDRDAFYDSVTHDLRQQVGDGRLRITRYKEMLTLDVADEILFDSAKAGLKPEGRKILLLVGKALSQSDKTIRVVGHTDNEAMVKGAAFATNWELSTARATVVVRFLQEQCGLNPQRLLAAGRGEWMPIASNKTAEGRQRNRRISITLIDAGLLDGSEGGVSPDPIVPVVK